MNTALGFQQNNQFTPYSNLALTGTSNSIGLGYVPSLPQTPQIGGLPNSGFDLTRTPVTNNPISQTIPQPNYGGGFPVQSALPISDPIQQQTGDYLTPFSFGSNNNTNALPNASNNIISRSPDFLARNTNGFLGNSNAFNPEQSLANLNNLAGNSLAQYSPQAKTAFLAQLDAQGISASDFYLNDPEGFAKGIEGAERGLSNQQQFGLSGRDIAGFGLQALNTIGSLYMGRKSLKLAEKNYELNRKALTANFKNNARSFNLKVADRNSGRGSAVMSRNQREALRRDTRRQQVSENLNDY